MSFLSSWVGKLQILTVLFGTLAVCLVANSYKIHSTHEVYFFAVATICCVLSAFLTLAGLLDFTTYWDCLNVAFQAGMGASLGVGCLVFLMSLTGPEDYFFYSSYSRYSSRYVRGSTTTKRYAALVLESINTLLYLIIAYRAHANRNNLQSKNAITEVPENSNSEAGFHAADPVRLHHAQQTEEHENNNNSHRYYPTAQALHAVENASNPVALPEHRDHPAGAAENPPTSESAPEHQSKETNTEEQPEGDKARQEQPVPPPWMTNGQGHQVMVYPPYGQPPAMYGQVGYPDGAMSMPYGGNHMMYYPGQQPVAPTAPAFSPGGYYPPNGRY